MTGEPTPDNPFEAKIVVNPTVPEGVVQFRDPVTGRVLAWMRVKPEAQDPDDG